MASFFTDEVGATRTCITQALRSSASLLRIPREGKLRPRKPQGPLPEASAGVLTSTLSPGVSHSPADSTFRVPPAEERVWSLGFRPVTFRRSTNFGDSRKRGKPSAAICDFAAVPTPPRKQVDHQLHIQERDRPCGSWKQKSERAVGPQCQLDQKSLSAEATAASTRPQAAPRAGGSLQDCVPLAYVQPLCFVMCAPSP